VSCLAFLRSEYPDSIPARISRGQEISMRNLVVVSLAMALAGCNTYCKHCAVKKALGKTGDCLVAMAAGLGESLIENAFYSAVRNVVDDEDEHEEEDDEDAMRLSKGKELRHHDNRKNLRRHQEERAYEEFLEFMEDEDFQPDDW
jgi:hypothetical protein